MQDFALVVAPGYADHSMERDMLAEAGVSLHILPVNASAAERGRLLAGARVLFVRDTRFDAQLLGKCTSAAGLIRYGVGVDGIDLEAAKAGGIKVANIPDYGADIEVADHTLALFLAVTRRIVKRDADVRRGIWGVGQAEPIKRVGGQTLGLIGYGRIARAVHRRFASFGIENVLIHDPFIPQEQAIECGVQPVELAELLMASDIISLHAPGGDPVKPLVDADFLARMKPGSILINTSRGSHVDEHALAAALASGHLSGAGLDVLRKEPPDIDNPLFDQPLAVLSDHAGWYSEATVATLQRRAGEEAVRMVKGQAPLNWVNP